MNILRQFSTRLLITAVVIALFCSSATAADPYEIAVYYFPNYHVDPRNESLFGKGWSEWILVREATARFPGHLQPKMPAWGYEDESDSKVMAKKIAAAADHGVTAFLFDWYWYEGKPFLQKPLDNGFLTAPNRSRLKFALMWANHDWLDFFHAKAGQPMKFIWPGTVTEQDFEPIVDHVIEKYFSQPNYWKIDGKPYFSIFDTANFIKGLGGVPQARKVLDGFRTKVKKAGHPGLHLNIILSGTSINREQIIALGFDSATSYNWGMHLDMPVVPATPYPPYAERAAKFYEDITRQCPVLYHVNVTQGYDASPRARQSDPLRNQGYPFCNVLTDNTPAEFAKALRRAKAFVDANPKLPRIITVNAWNEWTEGSYLEPDTRTGMKYLESLREVFPPQDSK